MALVLVLVSGIGHPDPCLPRVQLVQQSLIALHDVVAPQRHLRSDQLVLLQTDRQADRQTYRQTDRSVSEVGDSGRSNLPD